MGNTFQVDLGGVVDLLSRHLYSSSRVYLRELVQNAADAITARRLLDPEAPGRVVVTPADVAPDGRLHVEDTGIGLTREGIFDVLATIGRSSKRDVLGFSRDDFIGQFGIGLLSSFLVTDAVELTTLAADGTEVLRWHGRSDGTFDVAEAPGELAAPGTHVALGPRPGEAHLASSDTVGHLLRLYAAYLPCEVVLRTATGDVAVTGTPLPWEDPGLTGLPRRSAAVELCHELLGFAPMDVIELADSASGTRGFAFVLPQAVTRATHRVYAKHMLLSESCAEVLPEWAFFVRAVLNTDGLTPTASRESLYDDEALADARQRLGDQVQRWLARVAASDPARMREFLAVHHLGAKAMAARDDSMLEVVARWLPFETTLGPMSLADFVDHEGVLRYCDDVDDFRQVSQFAGARGLAVVNAGYAYDVLIIERLRQGAGASLETQRVSPTDLATTFEDPSEADRSAFLPLLDIAKVALERAGCVAQVRTFAPEQVQAVLLTDRSARRERDRAGVMDAVDGAWADLLGSIAAPDHRPRFVLNAANPTVRSLAGLLEPEVQRLAVEALYAHALVTGHHPMRPFDTAVVARALPALIDRAITRGALDDH